jgi:uncharacterized linocin/CFP29 family protein
MADSNSGPGWSEAQWEKVNNAVTEAFEKASVASAFIPTYGPLQGNAKTVRQETVNVAPPTPAAGTLTISVEDDSTLKLFNVTVHVTLSTEQVSDDTLSSALLAFRRAANILAQAQDHLVFNGRGAEKTSAEKRLPSAPAPPIQPGVSVTGEDSVKGLINVHSATNIADSAAKLKTLRSASSATPASNVIGQHLVTDIAGAVVHLETDGHPGPFVTFLGADAFVAAHTPETGSLVLPADRITPIINGPLSRSGQMPPTAGIVVSLAGSDIDVVVATPPRAQFLQMTSEAKYLFRVYEKFMIRVKDRTAIFGISI